MYSLKFNLRAVYVLGIFFALIASGSTAQAQQYASTERSSAAVGHYARARTLLVEALAEFEQASKLARPDLVLDAEEWRTSVTSRAEELNQILDPQPRVTRSGIYVRANPTLIRREKEQLPKVVDGPKSVNYQGELERKKRLAAARARMSEPVAKEQALDIKVEPEIKDKPTTAKSQSSVVKETAKIVPLDTTGVAEVKPVATVDQRKKEVEQEILDSISSKVDAMEDKIEAKEQAVGVAEGKKVAEIEPNPKIEASPAATEVRKQTVEAEEVSDDEAIAAAIEQALQKRLTELSSEGN